MTLHIATFAATLTFVAASTRAFAHRDKPLLPPYVSLPALPPALQSPPAGPASAVSQETP
ncbi:hypothetical protein [Xanthomonas albilineans]|uniref:hypothetical protein n=1 Tax=Xanthomonas albilineans TaxID=29447 RepID=UPI0002E2C07A|nr:hypothetical protein [Xanthomonas albilineans]QHQ27483.1 hypothetical protein XaFJ1_GM000731 [Xanthomonas albilineans]